LCSDNIRFADVCGQAVNFKRIPNDFGERDFLKVYRSKTDRKLFIVQSNGTMKC
jgi:hypothetical protein